LKALDIRVPDNLLGLLKMSSTDILYSIESTLDFAEALKPLIDCGEVEVELEEDKGDAVKYITDRLRELYSQGLGFLVFYGSKESLDNIKSLRTGNTPLWYRTIPGGRFFGKVLQPVEISVWEDPKHII